jgi:hypothetical protein
MTKIKLQRISNEFANSGIILDYSGSKFYSNGRIKTLDLKINNRDKYEMKVGANQIGLFLGSYGFKFVYDDSGNVKYVNCGNIF